MGQRGFCDSVYEGVATVPPRGEGAVVTARRRPGGFVFAFVLSRVDISSWMGTSIDPWVRGNISPRSGLVGFPNCLVRFYLLPKAGVFLSQCFHLVCVPLLVFCELLLHPGLGLQNAGNLWCWSGVPNFSSGNHGRDIRCPASRGNHLVSRGCCFGSVKYSSAPRWAPNVLTGPKVVIDKSLEGFGRLISDCSSIASKRIRGRSMGPAKDTPMPKSALVMWCQSIRIINA